MLVAKKNMNRSLIYRKEIIFNMKIKIFKKIITVLCAATISMSAISSVGAINVIIEHEQKQSEDLTSINDLIQKDLKTLAKIRTHYEANNKKGIVVSVDAISKNLSELDKQTIYYDEEFLQHSLLPSMKRIDKCINNINIGEKPLSDEAVQNCLKAANLIVARAMTAITKKNNNNKDIKINDKDKKISQSNQINQDSQNNNQINQTYMSPQQQYMLNKNSEKDDFNKENSQKNNSSHFQALDSKIMNDNILKDNISKIRNNMLKKVDTSKNALIIELNNKWNEFIRKEDETRIFANHKLVDFAPAKNIICNCFLNICDLNDGNDACREKKIKILDEAMSKLDKFMSDNDFTLPTFYLPYGHYLKKTYQDKFNELQALIENAKMNNSSFSFTKEYKTAENFINIIDWRADRELLESNLEEAIKKLDNAIKSIKPFSKGVVSKLPYLKWQDQAHDHIDELFNDAINKMQTSANQFSIDNIKKEFDQYLCGQQKFGNCWLYAACDMHNFLKHLEGKKDDIVRNKGERDGDDFDEVERFFNKPQFGFSMDKLKNVGGTLQDESDVLNKLEINHSRVHITIKKDSAQSRETAIKTAKTLLLKHFAASITPVLVVIMDDTVSCNVNNGLGGNHALVVVGLDIGKKAVVVANSQCGDLQEYSLDRIASAICNRGNTGEPLVHIEMIFPSFTHQNNFYYDNNIHSWDEFKSQLLPAISKPL